MPDNTLIKDPKPVLDSKIKVDWDKLFEDPKKVDWDALFETPKLEVDLTKPVSPVITDINVFRSFEEGQRQEKELMNNMTVYGRDLYNNDPVNILTINDDSKLSRSRLNKEFKEKFGENIDNNIFEQSVLDMQKNSQKQLGDIWYNKYAQTKQYAVEQSFDVAGDVGEIMTQEMYEKAYTKGWLNEKDRERADIQLQIRTEKDKSIEEGKDPLKIQSLQAKLNSLGKTYTDENGNVIDPKTVTAEQKEYVSMVDRYISNYSTTDEERLKEVYFQQYKYNQGIEEMYELEVEPWLKEQQELAGKGPYGGMGYFAMPKKLQKITDLRRESNAEMAALSKLYLANDSPANVKKGVVYSLKDALSSAVSGLYGEDFSKALQESVTTERQLLDATNKVVAFHGLPLTEEMQNKLDRTLLEYSNELGSAFIGLAPKFALAGRGVAALRTFKRLETLYGAWKGGKFAQAVNVVDKSNVFTKTAAFALDAGLEELKLKMAGFSLSGAGAGFAASHRLIPNIKLSNPVANLLFKILTTSAAGSSGIYLSKLTESAVESLYSYKPFNDLVAEQFGDWKEIAAVPISMLIFGFQKTSPDQFSKMKDFAKELKKSGDIEAYDWLNKQISTQEKIENKITKAVIKVKTKGKTVKDLAEEQETAAETAFAQELAKQKVSEEDQGLRERVVDKSKLSSVLRGSKIKDKEGNPQVWYYRTNAAFNIFSPRETGVSNVKNIKGLNWFSTDPEFGQGTNVQERYLNFKNPAKIGPAVKLTADKVQRLKDQGFDGIIATYKGKEVAASFGTQGIVRAESVDPFKSRNAEVMRGWAERLRSKDFEGRGIHLTIVPKENPELVKTFGRLDLQRAGKEALNVMADVLDVAASMVEVIEKGFAAMVKALPGYEKLDPEIRAKVDPLIRKRLQQALNESLPEAIKKRDLGWADLMVKEVKENYLPEFEKQGKTIADEMGGKFISDIKTPESIIAKKKRQGLEDIRDVSDILRGAVIVDNLQEFKDLGKRLKREGYSLHNKRIPDKTGYRGVYATKRMGDLGVEIQLHTDKTWEAQNKAHEIYKKYRDKDIETPNIAKVNPPETYISNAPKSGSVKLGEIQGEEIKEENIKYSEPHLDYEEANGAAVNSKAKNLWVKPDGSKDNSKRVLMMQFTSELMGVPEEKTNKAPEYYASIYKEIPGYNRAKDFWEIPQWQANLAASFKEADSYVIRDIPEAVEFLQKSGYKEVAFSVLDVTKEKVKALAEALPDIKFNVGGYIEPLAEYFKDNPNVKTFGSIEEMAKAHGVSFVPGYDYRHFKGTKIIPRLQLSTGCKYSCAFCSIPKDVKSTDKTIIDSQVEALKDLNASLIYLDDKTFGQADNFTYLTDVYKKLKHNNPDFQGFIVQTTALDFANKNKFSSDFLKTSGIKFVELGIETYNDDILKGLNKKHSSKKYTDAAMENARENGIKVIPNIIIGFEAETKESYENTLQFINDNKDIISHVNIYNLAIYKGTPLANSIEAKVDADFNENIVEKSFHVNPELHKEYLGKFLDLAKNIVETGGPKMRYEQDITESQRLFDEAYADLENVNLEGSRAPYAHERKMRELEIPVSTQRELKKAWTVTKNKLLGELKGKNAEMKDAFKDFVNNIPGLTGLRIKLKPAMLRRVNSIDFTKPTSLNKAIQYFEKIVNNATERAQLIEFEKTYNDIDTRTSDSFLTKRNDKGVFKNKLGPSGLDLYDELKSIRKDMMEKDWEEGQNRIIELFNKIETENRELTPEEFNQITRLGFYGVLNSTNKLSLDELKGVKRDLYEVIKEGKTKAAADRFIKYTQRIEFENDQVFKVLDGRKGKPVELNENFIVNKRATALERMQSWFDWPMTSSYLSHLDVLSKFDKTSKPGESILNDVYGGSVVDANTNIYVDQKNLFEEISDKQKEIFGTISDRDLRKKARKRTTEIHTIKYKDIFGTERDFNITTDQAIKKYMEFQDPTLEAANESGGYMRGGELTDLGKKVENVLTKEDKAWADWQLDYFYPKLKDFFNPAYRSLYGMDMPYGEKYSPIYVQGAVNEAVTNQDLLAKQTFLSGLKNNHIISRVKHASPLRLIGADEALTSYVHNMTYWKNWTEPIQLLNSAFIKNQAIRAAVRQNFGDDHLRVMQDHIDYFTRRPTDIWKTAGWLGKVRNNFLLGSMSLKFPVGLKQLSAAPAYLEYIPVKDIPEYFWKSATDWKTNLEIFKKIWNSPYMKQRYGAGWDIVLTDIMAKDLHDLSSKHDWRSKLLFPTKYGDAGSIFLGGVPIYRYYYDKTLKETGSEKIADIEAMRKFVEATGSTQQSGQPYDLSVFQRSNDFFKAMTMYKSAPMQYHRKVSAALRGLVHGRGTWEQNAKVIALYHVVLPQIFQWMSNGFKWNWDDQKWAAILGNYNELFAAGDIIDGVVNTVRGEPWKEYEVSPLLGSFRDMTEGIEHLMKINPSITKKDLKKAGIPDDYMNQVLKAAEDMPLDYVELGKAFKNINNVIGDWTGLPNHAIYNITKGTYDVITGKEKESKILRIIGFSGYTLDAAEDATGIDLEDLKDLQKDINNTKTPSLKKIIDKEEQRKKRIPDF